MWPLADASVVDASVGVAGPLCTRLLREAGASVTTVELEGSGGRGVAPPRSAFLDAGKRRVSIDPSSSGDRATLDELLAGADLLVTSALHGAGVAGLDCEAARVRRPELLALCVTPFGQTGPAASYAADDLVVSALCGLADATPGFPDHQERDDDPPVQSLAPLAESAGGILAACAVFGPLAARLEGRPGAGHVEVAIVEAAAAMMVLEWGTTAYGGGVHGRRPGHDFPEPNVYLRCADGDLVVVAFREEHWRALVELMGNPAWASEPAFADPASRRANRDRLHAHLQSWTGTQRGLDVLEAAQGRGLACCPALDLSDVLSGGQVREVGSVVEDEHGVRPTDPIVIDGARRPSPRAASAPRARPAGTTGRPATAPASPLAGIRVLDLSHIVAGPFCGQLLAALGADVVLVESRSYLVSRSFGPFVGEPAHDASMMFNQVNRGKRSVELDLTTPAGKEALHELVRSADVVLENLSRRAAESLGLTYAELARDRPELVLASISGFGRRGPWGDWVALHSGVILLSGLASVTRDASGRPRLAGSIYPDPLSGATTALAIQEALAWRERTGRGCHIEVSMLDVLLTCMGDLVTSAARGEPFAPHPGRFLRSAEPGGFVAVAPDVGDRIDEVERLVAGKTRREAMAQLQSEGTKAGAVLTIADVMEDPHLAGRGFVLEDDHPVATGRLVPAVPWLVDGTRPRLRHAPCLGDATAEVLGTIGGLPAGEEERMRAEAAPL